MKNNKLFRIILISSALLLPLTSLLPVAAPGQPSTPTVYQVRIVEEPSKHESDLSKSAAGFVTFITDGMRSTWNRYFVPKQGLTPLEALQYAAFQGILLATPALMGIILKEGSKAAIEVIKNDMIAKKITILNQEQNPFYGKLDRLWRWYAGK